MSAGPSRAVRWFNLPLWLARTVEASLWSYRGPRRRLTLARLRGSLRPRLERPIFIVGAARSGTTFLGSCIGAMPGISYHHEPVLPKAAVEAIATDRWSRRQAAWMYRSVYRGLLRLHLDGDLRFADKTPRNCYVVDELAEIFPDAKFLHIVRDGRDAALSLSRRPWLRSAADGSGAVEPGGYAYGTAPRFWVEPARVEEFRRVSDIRRCAWAWRRHTQAALDSLARIPERSLEVRYERLVAEPVEQGNRILDFLELEDEKNRGALLTAVADASRRSVGRWRKELTASQVDEIEAEAGSLLRELGYERGSGAAEPRTERGASLLMIAPYPVLPASTGGKIRIVRLAEQLAKRGIEVTILTPYKPGQEGHAHSLPFGLRQVMYPFALPFLATDRPFSYAFLVSLHPWYARHLRSWMSTFDLVQFEHVSFADLATLLPEDLPVIYDAHNVEVDYVEAETNWPPARRLAARRIRRFERDLAHRADRVLSCSRDEGDRLVELYQVPRERIRVVPNGVRRAERTPASPADLPPGLERLLAANRGRGAVFSGSDVDHNRRVVRWLIEELAPAVAGHCVVVIHGECGSRFERTASSGNLFHDPDWRGFARYARPEFVALNPVTSGAGTNLKLTHALAHGIPMVTTEFGMRGYSDLRSQVLVRALHEFAPALVAWEFPQPRPEALGVYTWEHLADGLAREYGILLDEVTRRRDGHRTSESADRGPTVP